MPKRKDGLILAVLVLFGINLLNFYDRNAPGALVEPMRHEFTLSDTQIGLMGSMFIWIYAIVGIPFGRIADVWSRKKLLAIGVVLWTSLTAMAAFAQSFSFLLFTRLGVGIGEAVCAPTGTSWIGDLFPTAKRARALGVFMLAVPIGGAMSYFFSGPIAQAWGWRMAMVAAAAPGLLLVPALYFVTEPARGAAEQQSVAGKTPTPWSVFGIPTLWWIIASGIFLNFNMYALGTFLPAFLSRVHGYSLARSGVATGFVYLIGGLCGGTLGGQLGDFVVRKGPTGRLLTAAALAAFGVPFAYFGMIQPIGATILALAFLTVAYGALNTYYALVYSSIQDIVGPKQRGFTMSVYFMAMYSCGASFSPLLTGNLSDRFAKNAMAAAGATKMTEAFRATGLQQAMLVIPILSVALAIVLYFGSRTIAKDVARRDAALQQAA
jgi:predicted MFS family arabinose efflux permease